MAVTLIRPTLFSIKPKLLFPITPFKNTSAPFLFPKSPPFLAFQRKTFAATMSKASSYQIPKDYEMPELLKPRHIVRKVLARQMKEGDGATVRRSIGGPDLRNFDPFLLLDDFAVSHPAGFPDHPHRGFETVTYMLEGYFTHEDFTGHKGTIRAGDIQWMTAGRGIVHSELPAREGVQKGLQLWVNLSSKNKMVEPQWQEIQSKDIVRVNKDGIDVRIIAGEAFGVSSPVYTRTPTMYLHFVMNPGAELRQRIPEEWNSFAYVMDGEGVFVDEASAPISKYHCLVLSKGDGLRVWNKSDKQLHFVLLSGEPLNEPVVQYGPFVMNTQREIQQAFDDYRRGKNGFENANEWSARAERL